MDFTVTTTLPDSLASLRQARMARAYAPQNGNAAIKADTSLPAVPEKIPANINTQGTRLINQAQDDLEGGGYRLTKTFEREDGRTFMKVEEFALTNRGARKTVIQQTPSGSITRYEEVLDREDSGNFRRTQRFQDETGEISTSITAGYQVTDPFVLTGGGAPVTYMTASPYTSPRGTQLDLST